MNKWHGSWTRSCPWCTEVSDPESTLRTLVDTFGTEIIVVDEDLKSSYDIDWTRRYRGRSLAVLRPRDTAEIAAMVTWCRDHRVSLVAQGGNTGLVGGSIPDDSGHSLVMSTRSLDQIGELDSVAGQITVGAGVTLGRLEHHLAATPWEFGVDLGARDSATLGGMAATNAGGMRVLRHGTMRANVIGVEAVLGTGEIVSHLTGLVKDNTGYDLAGLLCGSEGTLGIITHLRLRLVPRPTDRAVVWVACEGWDDAVHLATRARHSIEGLDAIEAIDRRSVELVAAATGVSPLVDPVPSVTVILAWAGRGDVPDALGAVVEDRRQGVAVESGPMNAIWERRERVTEAISARGVPHKLDVTVPLGRIAEFVSRLEQELGDLDLAVFGHLGDGNLHVNIVGGGDGQGRHDPDTLDAMVLGTVAELSGSISAEHGIGRHKVGWLHLSRTAAELSAFARLKAAFDPNGILNPGVLIAR